MLTFTDVGFFHVPPILTFVAGVYVVVCPLVEEYNVPVDEDVRVPVDDEVNIPVEEVALVSVADLQFLLHPLAHWKLHPVWQSFSQLPKHVPSQYAVQPEQLHPP